MRAIRRRGHPSRQYLGVGVGACGIGSDGMGGIADGSANRGESSCTCALLCDVRLFPGNRLDGGTCAWRIRPRSGFMFALLLDDWSVLVFDARDAHFVEPKEPLTPTFSP